MTTDEKRSVELPSTAPLTIIESPFGSPDRLIQLRNKLYLARCCQDCWHRGEVPYASHAFFPLFLNEKVPEDRDAGIAGGYYMWKFATIIAFYTDFGMSKGMTAARSRAERIISETAPKNPFQIDVRNIAAMRPK